MRVSLITPVDIKYSYRATEWLVYEYAKFLKEQELDAKILITENVRRYPALSNYKKLLEPYKSVPKSDIGCKEYLLPFKWHLFVYSGLPRNDTIYFPYSIYDYIINILKKPKGQKYIIGCHSLHLKNGHIIENKALEKVLNLAIKAMLFFQRKEMGNLYCHALNSEQANYMIKEFNFLKKNVFTIPVMIDAKQYKASKSKGGTLRVVHIGGMGKNVQVVLDTITKLSNMGELTKFEFYFIGNITSGAKIPFKGFENVHFLGPISDNEKAKVISTMDAIIIPAFESFPKTMLEGLVSGLYVLTSKKNAAWRDILNLKIKIMVTESGNAEEYTNALLRLKSGNPSLRKNREITIRNFDKAVILSKMLKMFKEVNK